MSEVPANRAMYLKLADELDLNLSQHVLGKWFPAAILPDGGYAQDFDRAWNPLERATKPSVVYHSRLIYAASFAAQTGHGDPRELEGWATHGVSALKTQFWDEENGGFSWSAGSKLKHLYGVAFAIYALSTFHRAFGTTDSVRLAADAFRWLDRNAHDDACGGYFEVLDAHGCPVHDCALTRPVTGKADKSMNTHIHLLEAFSALYAESPSAPLKKRILELLDVLTEKVYNGAGLSLFFDREWVVRDKVDSYGHDIETAFLLIEAAETVGIESPRVQQVARALVDHTLEVAWDVENGGIFDEGSTTTPHRLTKVWWAQAESLNALLLMHELHGATDGRYWTHFVAQWRFIQESQVDPVHGGWFAGVLADGNPMDSPKSGPWTDPYHQGRALINSSRRLRHLAEAGWSATGS